MARYLQGVSVRAVSESGLSAGLCHQPGEQSVVYQRSAADEVFDLCHRRL